MDEPIHPPLPKQERLRLFFQRLLAVPPASSHDEARALLADTLTRVEDEFSGVPAEPESPLRMYPPLDDNRRAVPGAAGLARYRSASHFTFIGTSGAILITKLNRQRVFEKPGGDGRTIDPADAFPAG
jgi:hypothetical protein